MTARPGSVPATALAVSNPAVDVDSDLAALAAFALGHGAARAEPVHARHVVVDEHVARTAHRSGCDGSCSSLMSPPYSPGAEQFAGWLAGFERGVLVQVAVEATPELAALAQGAGGWCCDLAALRRTEAYEATLAPLWRTLHDVVSRVEREAMRRGYYLSVGLVAGDCELCAACDPSCLCRNPLAARPSLEAVGIDVGRTLRNAGWDEAGTGRHAVRTGLVLVV